mmetsp:Transcript_17852/g.35250  ORF Transcript_17852/g.35250 Transcript_17852/m.35250 type:complete len:242 (-) Transcript_17852:583-1308(-)
MHPIETSGYNFIIEAKALAEVALVQVAKAISLGKRGGRHDLGSRCEALAEFGNVSRANTTAATNDRSACRYPTRGKLSIETRADVSANLHQGFIGIRPLASRRLEECIRVYTHTVGWAMRADVSSSLADSILHNFELRAVKEHSLDKAVDVCFADGIDPFGDSLVGAKKRTVVLKCARNPDGLAVLGAELNGELRFGNAGEGLDKEEVGEVRLRIDQNRPDLASKFFVKGFRAVASQCRRN